MASSVHVGDIWQWPAMYHSLPNPFVIRPPCGCPIPFDMSYPAMSLPSLQYTVLLSSSPASIARIRPHDVSLASRLCLGFLFHFAIELRGSKSKELFRASSLLVLCARSLSIPA
ncbi:hypothetical protein M9H77_27639 [Catharanthus roseus]|uniref:Uncharacterized protein n=1 Tax=Catharanthus roseus TaxID=4058 RepID=A0ACC0AH79_CATRO|nr:hypothetical protein M9H77_27639 [Catharanthus roseus]